MKEVHPVEAHRKQERRQELKKQKEARKERKLQSQDPAGTASAGGSESKRPLAKKADAASKAPDNAHVIYLPPGARLSNVEHVPPEQSPYYDQQFNPYGAPPPGTILEFAIVVPRALGTAKTPAKALAAAQPVHATPVGAVDPFAGRASALPPPPAAVSGKSHNADLQREFDAADALLEKTFSEIDRLGAGISSEHMRERSLRHVPFPDGPALSGEPRLRYFFELPTLPFVRAPRDGVRAEIAEKRKAFAAERASKPRPAPRHPAAMASKRPRKDGPPRPPAFKAGPAGPIKISAEPQLRNLRAEVTAMVPAAQIRAKRKLAESQVQE